MSEKQQFPKMIYRNGRISAAEKDQRIVRDADELEAALADGFKAAEFQEKKIIGDVVTVGLSKKAKEAKAEGA